METFFQNFTLSDWKDISIVFQGILMICLVGATAYQFSALRNENKKSRTHEMSDRYSCDPIIHNAVRVTRNAWIDGDIFKNPDRYRDELRTVLNYLNALAIGIENRIYNEEFAFAVLQDVVRIQAKRYLNDRTFLEKTFPGITEGTWVPLFRLSRKWDERPDAGFLPKSAIESPTKCEVQK